MRPYILSGDQAVKARSALEDILSRFDIPYLLVHRLDERYYTLRRNTNGDWYLFTLGYRTPEFRVGRIIIRVVDGIINVWMPNRFGKWGYWQFYLQRD